MRSFEMRRKFNPKNKNLSVTVKMWPRKCHSLALLILIYASLVTTLLADFKDDLDQSKVVNFLKNVQKRNQMSSNFRREGQRNFSNPCSAHIYEFIDSLLKQEMWTFKMIDAASKIPSGLLIGNINDLGMYDECLGIREKKNGKEIRGRHCMYNIGLKLNSEEFNQLKPRLSVCVPSNCNSSDVTQLLELIIFKMTNISSIGISSVKATCSGIDPMKWSSGSIAALSLIGAIILFLLVCTLLDFLQMQLNIENNSLKTLSKFSMQKSALQILKTKVYSGSIPAINGIRFLSICWIIMGHGYNARGKMAALVNKLDILEWSNTGDTLYVVLSVFAVDSFFTLSGFLMSYVFIKEMSKGGKFNLFSYYLHRYIRLTPALGMLLIFTIFVIPHIGSGPLWEEQINKNKCSDIWWITILYLQNFVKADSQCLGHLWYLAVDMQLFWYSPIILYPLSKKPKLGLAILAASFAASLITVATIASTSEYSFILTRGKNKNVFKNLYSTPYSRAGPWLIGIFFGYITVLKEINLKRGTATLGWCIAFISFGFCTLGLGIMLKKDYQHNVVWETIFATLARSIWALGLSWIILASVTGRGGAVTKFLSLSIFLPLAKLSYCLYLVHAAVQEVLTKSEIVNTYFSEFTMIMGCLNDVILSVVVAFFFSLFFESPMLILEKIIFPRKKIEARKDFREDVHNEKVKSSDIKINLK